MDCGLYQQGSFRRAAGCEFRPGGLALTDELAAACRLQPGERVLDLACGVGSTASHLASAYGASVAGLDATPEFLAEARRRDAGGEWVCGSADATPFGDASFDVVFAECFLSGCADRPAVLREVRRLLRPGGRLAVSDMYLREPGAAPPGLPVPGATCLSGAIGEEATLAAFAGAGFRVVWWQDRSDTLKALMASLIMEYGSAAAFWEAATAGGAATGAALRAARPGYHLLVAEVSGAPREGVCGG